MNDTTPYPIPSSWKWTKLESIAEIARQQVNPRLTPAKKFNYLSIENVEATSGELVNFTPTLGDKIKSAKIAFTTNDVLYSKLRPYLNKVHLPDFDGVSATDLIPIRPLGGIPREYLAYFLRSRLVVDYASQRMRGIQLPRVPVDQLLKLPVPVAPLSEQKQIVETVEKALWLIKGARKALGKIPTSIKQLRQSVLSKAFRGELTERDPGDESAEELLERANEERNMGRTIHAIRSKSSESRDEEPSVSSDIKEPYSVPPVWRWTTIGNVTESSFYGPRFAKNEYQENGIVTLRTTDIDANGEIHMRNPPRIRLTEDQIDHFGLKIGDLLIARSGSIGKCGIFDHVAEPAIPGAYLIRFRILKDIVPPKYVLHYFLSPMGQSLLKGGASAITQANINARKIERFPIPLAPEAEIKQIVSKIEVLLAKADRIDEQIMLARRDIDELEQVVLAHAFRGELVDQDSSNEPASILLERIRTQA